MGRVDESVRRIGQKERQGTIFIFVKIAINREWMWGNKEKPGIRPWRCKEDEKKVRSVENRKRRKNIGFIEKVRKVEQTQTGVREGTEID